MIPIINVSVKSTYNAMNKTCQFHAYCIEEANNNFVKRVASNELIPVLPVKVFSLNNLRRKQAFGILTCFGVAILLMLMS